MAILHEAQDSGQSSSSTFSSVKSLVRRQQALLVSAVSLVVFFSLWQSSGSYLKPIYFSTPSKVVSTFLGMIISGELIRATAATILTVIIGLALASVVGISIGLIIGRSRRARQTIAPLISMAIAAPFVALLPLMEIWFGLGLAARVAFTFILCIWMMIINTFVGVSSLLGSYNELAESMSLSKFETLRYVVLPGASPFIFAGLRIAVAQAIVGAVLAGQEVGTSGLGGLANNYGSFFQTPQLLATITASTIMAFIFFGLLRFYQNVRSPWIHATGQG
ncbi:MAG: ABC transporter permease [Acidimicrobiaceae bacterium]|nr:ABC transporter permease [Acidimicrobiaceae bacterium]